MRVLNTEQMREADRRTIEDIGLPSIVLMENAGRQTVAAMEAAFESLGSSRVAVLCGRGNNGGDGFVVARTLAQRGVEALVFLLGSGHDVQREPASISRSWRIGMRCRDPNARMELNSARSGVRGMSRLVGLDSGAAERLFETRCRLKSSA